MAADLNELVAHLDEFLEVDAVPDESLNGLQVEGDTEIRRVAVAVDAAAATIDAASAEGCQLLLVHHGLFWGRPQPLIGILADKLRRCFRAGLSIYAAHLPLDRHPEVGNNVLLARALGGTVEEEFGEVGGVPIGVVARLQAACDAGGLAGRLAAAGSPEAILWSFGPATIERVAVVTGSGCSLLEAAAATGADCFVTGEPKHGAYHVARELGIHCVFGGHYATETHGVKALGDHLRGRYDLEIVWIDHPTGI